MAWTSPEDVGRLVFSPSGLLLATTRCCGDDSDPDALRLWDALSGEELAHLTGIDPVFSLAFVSERTLYLVVTGGCQLWDSESGEVHSVWKGASNCGTVVLDGKAVVVAPRSRSWPSRDGTLVVRQLPAGKVFHQHQLRVPAQTEAWYDDLVATGRYLASFSRANHHAYTLLTLWDVERGKRLRTYDIGAHDAYHMALHPEGTMLAVLVGNRVCSFGLDDEEEREDFKSYKSDSVSALRYSPDGRTLQVLCKGKVVRLDAVTGRQLSSSKIPASFTYHRGTIDSAGEKVAVNVDREIEVLDILDG